MHILETQVIYNTEDSFLPLFIAPQNDAQHQPCYRHFPALHELQYMF